MKVRTGQRAGQLSDLFQGNCHSNFPSHPIGQNLANLAARRAKKQSVCSGWPCVTAITGNGGSGYRGRQTSIPGLFPLGASRSPSFDNHRSPTEDGPLGAKQTPGKSHGSCSPPQVLKQGLQGDYYGLEFHSETTVLFWFNISTALFTYSLTHSLGDLGIQG